MNKNKILKQAKNIFEFIKSSIFKLKQQRWTHLFIYIHFFAIFFLLLDVIHVSISPDEQFYPLDKAFMIEMSFFILLSLVFIVGIIILLTLWVLHFKFKHIYKIKSNFLLNNNIYHYVWIFGAITSICFDFISCTLYLYLFFF